MEAVKLVESGVATAEDIDIACKLGFGHAMGPLATTDLTGVDILRRALQHLHRDRRESSPRRSCSAGWSIAGDLGRKSGQGFYDLRRLTWPRTSPG